MEVKIGACEWALPGGGIASIRLASEVGIEGLQLNFASYERGFLLSQKWFRDYYMEEASRYGIALPSMAVCELDFYGLKRKKGTEKGDILYQILDMAVEAAADMRMEMIMLPSFHDGYMETDEDITNTADALRYACDIAAPYGIFITTENLLTLDKNNELLQLTNRKNLRCFYDSQNYKSSLGWAQVEMLRGLYDLLYPEIHLKDGIGQSNSCRLLGEGDSDFLGTMCVLHEKRYAGWLHLENYYDRSPLRELAPRNYADVLRRDIEILKQALK